MTTLNKGLRLGQQQTLFHLANVVLVPDMNAQVQIAPRGWLARTALLNQQQAPDISRDTSCDIGDCQTTYADSLRFPFVVDAQLCFYEQAVLMDKFDVTHWQHGLYEAQILLQHNGHTQVIDTVILFEVVEHDTK